MMKFQRSDTDPTGTPSTARRASKKAALLGAVALGAVAGPGFLETAYFPSHALAQAQVEGAERPARRLRPRPSLPSPTWWTA